MVLDTVSSSRTAVIQKQVVFTYLLLIPCQVIGAGMTVSPAESLAVITANYKDIPGFSTNAAGLGAVVRSVVTAPAVDRVTESLDIPCVQTPTGWKWLSRATQACVDGGLGARSGGAVLCGEESFGLGKGGARA